ncbi:MAG: LPS export ABC transporter periplasmic protein LptC, partial [Gemmatimonadales bacterium]
MRPLRLIGFVVVGAALAFSVEQAHAQAPARQCLLQYETSSGNTRTNAQKIPSGQYNFFQGGGVTYHCEGQDNTLIADSAEYYGDQKVLYMIGNVHYTEPRAKVDSDRMTYYQVEDRLRSEGNVNVRTQTGTTIRGPLIDYYRATTARPLARTIATGRPHMSIAQRRTGAEPPDPVDVVANSLVAEGDNLVYASGNVEVTRPDLLAKSDSAFLDGTREFARLMKTPSVESRQGRPFTLSGGVIDLFSRARQLERVVASPSGHVLSQDLELVADTVDLRITKNKIQRVIAFGRMSRSQALSPER